MSPLDLQVKDFSSSASSAREAIHSISASESRYATADLTQLFKIAHQEGKRAESQGRLLRVVSFFIVMSQGHIAFK
jgi:BRISC and BRCA1-A complex member 1